MDYIRVAVLGSVADSAHRPHLLGVEQGCALQDCAKVPGSLDKAVDVGEGQPEGGHMTWSSTFLYPETS